MYCLLRSAAVGKVSNPGVLTFQAKGYAVQLHIPVYITIISSQNNCSLNKHCRISNIFGSLIIDCFWKAPSQMDWEKKTYTLHFINTLTALSRLSVIINLNKRCSFWQINIWLHIYLEQQPVRELIVISLSEKLMIMPLASYP